MAGIKKLTKSFIRLVAPTLVVAIVAVGVASVWLVHETSRPYNNIYLVTPEQYGMLARAQVTNETGERRRHDGTMMAFARHSECFRRHSAPQI